MLSRKSKKRKILS